MSVEISRPPGVNVGVNNPGDIVYIQGSESVDGSIRLEITQVDSTDVTEIQKRISGIWQPTSLKTGPNSVFIGLNVALGAAGHHLITVDPDGHQHFHGHNTFDGELTIADATILNAYFAADRVIIQPDDSGEFTGTLIGFAALTGLHVLSRVGYLKVGATAASDTIRIQIFDGTDNTGTVIFDQSYPASQFPANTEITFAADGFIEFETGQTTFLQISSPGTFSLKMNAAVTEFWFASDVSLIHEDDMLQTTEWISGDSFSQGVLTIQDRKIYEANETGIQTVSFDDNIDKWDQLISIQGFDRILNSVDGNSIANNAGNLLVGSA